MKGDAKKLYLLGGILIGGVLVLVYFIIFPVQSDTDNSNVASELTENNNETSEDITNTEPTIPETGPLYEAARARDIKRLTDIRTLFSALASYFDDNGNYPTTIQELIPDYIPGMITNPTPGGMDYVYTPIGVEPAKFYSIYYKFEVGVENISAGEHEATPQGYVTQ